MNLKELQNSSLDEVWCNMIVEELVRQGVTSFFVAPGSRSTPLAVAVAYHTKIDSYIFWDERSLGYCAVGCSKGLQRTVAVITTSGTAVANLFPAIIEASLDFAPMIILTADRPYELRDTGANQTIDQVKIFKDYVRWYFEIPPPNEQIEPKAILSTIDYAVYKSNLNSPGPVHLNCLFREPFFNKKVSFDYVKYKYYASWINNKQVFCNYFPDFFYTSNNNFNFHDYAQWLSKYEKGLIISGKNINKDLVSLLTKLSKLLQWPLLPDILSNARLDKYSENLINYYNLIFKNSNIKYPDIIIRFGTRFISKELSQYMEEANEAIHIHINNLSERFDPNNQVTDNLTIEPNFFCSGIVKELQKFHITRHSNWLSSWITQNSKIENKLNILFNWNKVTISEPGIIRFLFEHWPEGYLGYLGSSMPIRDADSFATYKNNSNVIIHANRGASGIDGNIATAIGLSLGTQKNILCILGDLAFLHDFTSLALTKELQKTMIFIVINNQGGGIFSFLPINKDKKICEKFFATSHNLTFSHIAKQFSLHYYNPKDYNTCKKHLQECISNNYKAIFEISSERNYNYNFHKWIYENIENL
nr:2-succinyl-6-hydroxy-2, 4-cyclohexadiene-1-carboxylate synthase [Cavernulicola chilensis]